ncbi:GH15 family glucan-1,4-alpha-glucosidase [Pontibacter ummariensis]|uniref:Glucoamylase (Glucan-1,4-alpha-glucosidase), GH15 family n=1 Tax=Pontibacter ummariensis TaxID=1610492 RepID=A0A239IC53_9BACT|nr:glycoside hydrolase family 15 protein [Pontibacter ummariensis]PRY09936.1 GH15 family glucan-1,4-alpha-glucosidase [Pontibacter ummariensis]SNS91137.1 Glucoamylase (glucan-1,4-alpha-glucosidase), GH15 family [Pontibacter ummariensis]
MKEYLPIEDYGLLGNLHTTALVSKKGSVDYLPFTRYDSPTVFAAILDNEKGGYWSIHPDAPNVRYKQQYLPDTGVLLTRFLTEEGMAELTDFMPVREEEERGALVRELKVITGEIRIKMECKARMNYARSGHRLKKLDDGYQFSSKGEDSTQFRFVCNAPVEERDGDLYGDWVLKQGETLSFVIETMQSPTAFKQQELQSYTAAAFQETVNFWQKWVAKSNYNGRWHEMVVRSAITLKMLTSYKYGSTIAAATFGLPETIGGIRNWDYRYTWIRDTTFAMYSFLQLGFRHEAQQFIDWLMRRCEEIKDPADLQLMYAVDGTSSLSEKVLDNLQGYRGSSPVRIGNGASKQFQLDMYGEMVQTIYLYDRHGGPITFEFWQNVKRFVDFVADNWHRKDHGIWEVRKHEAEFIHSKIMCWTALDRGIKLARERSFPAPLDHWREVRDKIYFDVYYNYWNEERQAFVQYRGAKVLDAAVLMMPLLGMFSPSEPRWQSTLKALEESLITDTLVYRYKQDSALDSLPGKEGTFSLCSFWYIENLAKAGEIEKARLYFDKMVGYSNHLGLYSEQIGLQGQLLGNFPQAFTHLALISAALELERGLGSEKAERSGSLSST